MNKRFVKEEVLTSENLEKVGFIIRNKKLETNYDQKTTELILDKIEKLIDKKIITTRENRGKLSELLKKNYPDLKLKKFDTTKKITSVSIKKRRTKISSNPDPIIFGKSLILKEGDTNNIHRDIIKLYNFYIKYEDSLSQNFPSLIRMSLRLLIESAQDTEEDRPKINKYINKYFDKAKKTLSADQKTTLSAQSIDKKALIKLLHIGAHNYSASNNLPQTIAMALIIGAMLQLSHKRE